jgi:RnfABCDGE-type electron transport complex B subunit
MESLLFGFGGALGFTMVMIMYAGIRELADLLGREFVPFSEGAAPKTKSVAFIDENTCIGCTLCILACPVDAIVGAAKQFTLLNFQNATSYIY